MRGMRRIAATWLCTLALLLVLGGAGGEATAKPSAETAAGSGAVTIGDGARPLLREAPALRLGFRSAGRWQRAARVVSRRRAGATTWLELSTSDPRGRRIELALSEGPWVVLRARVLGRGPAVSGVGMGFALRRGERLLGFGERSNAVDQRGNEVLNRVQEGPFAPAEYAAVDPTIPDWALLRRRDATYFPMPWLLSTAGYGVLVSNREESRFKLGSERRGIWSVEVAAERLELRVLAGRPSALVRQLTRITGRQPPPAAPWLLGPWFQSGHQNVEPGELGYARRLRRADAPVSAVETHMRYMPCGADQGQEAAERARTRGFHRLGLAALSYAREAVCQSYGTAFARGAAERVFLRRPDGSPYTFEAFVGGGVTGLGMIDFGNPRSDAFYASLLRRLTANGYDGWMEDYGEYVPTAARSANGMTDATLRNLYPVLYHRSGYRFARSQRRPLARFIRSGWTGVHPYAQIVWGGDPTTGWGFDGLRSSVTQALTMGLSGISLWGSDIGGFFTLSRERLTPELLTRWIQFGAVSGVMRTKAEGIGADQERRPQVWQRSMLPAWRRYAKLRTQLYPYLVAADREYRRSGMPIMRHLALAYPGDRRAAASDDSFLFGPDLLAAPVTRPAQRRRGIYVPRGRWVDLWRSLDYLPRSGGLRLRGARSLRGGRGHSLPAPLAELPLLARAGTLLPLLAPDVDTLADHGPDAGIVKLAERRDRLGLLAFPRGDSSARFDRDGRLRSSEAGPGWTLAVSGSRARRFQLQASLGTLERPFTPGAVQVGGRRLERSAWSYDPRGRVLRARFSGRRTTLRVLPAR